MALREILKYPDPFLKKVALPVDKVDDEIRKLIKDMVDTMYHARGIGLAATQIGVDKRVAVLDVPSDADDKERTDLERGQNLIALVNPEIVDPAGTVVYEEGCLSVPGVTAEVTRAATLRIKALDKDGNPVDLPADGLFAIAVQHEIDHLNGVLFIEHLSRLRRSLIKRRLEKAYAEEHAL